MRPNEQDVAERRRRGAGPARAAGGVRVAAITMPVTEAYVSLARLATAHVAGVLGMSVSRVSDLRLAVDEACGQFLFGPPPRFEDFEDEVVEDADGIDVLVPLGDLALPLEPLELCFDQLPGKLRITVSGPVPAVAWPDRGGLGWLVLDALVSDIRSELGPQDGVGTLTIIEPLSADDASRDALWFAAL